MYPVLREAPERLPALVTDIPVATRITRARAVLDQCNVVITTQGDISTLVEGALVDQAREQVAFMGTAYDGRLAELAERQATETASEGKEAARSSLRRVVEASVFPSSAKMDGVNAKLVRGEIMRTTHPDTAAAASDDMDSRQRQGALFRALTAARMLRTPAAEQRLYARHVVDRRSTDDVATTELDIQSLEIDAYRAHVATLAGTSRFQTVAEAQEWLDGQVLKKPHLQRAGALSFLNTTILHTLNVTEDGRIRMPQSDASPQIAQNLGAVMQILQRVESDNTTARDLANVSVSNLDAQILRVIARVESLVEQFGIRSDRWSVERLRTVYETTQLLRRVSEMFEAPKISLGEIALRGLFNAEFGNPNKNLFNNRGQYNENW